jgi:hypothetical protein
LLEPEDPPHAARPKDRTRRETAAATAFVRFGIVTFCIGGIENIKNMKIWAK